MYSAPVLWLGKRLLILVQSTWIRLYLPCTDWFWTANGRVRLLFQINRKMVNTIWFQVDLIRFLSVQRTFIILIFPNFLSTNKRSTFKILSSQSTNLSPPITGQHSNFSLPMNIKYSNFYNRSMQNFKICQPINEQHSHLSTNEHTSNLGSYAYNHRGSF